MDMSRDNWISASSPAKQESLLKISERISRLLDLLRAVDPLLSDWYLPTSPDTRVRVPSDLLSLQKLIYSQSCINGASNPRMEFGYVFGCTNIGDSDDRQPTGMMVMMNAGGTGSGSDRIWLQNDPGVVPDPRLVSYGITKKILFALADAFDPVFSYAYPVTLRTVLARPPREDKRPFGAGWMVLLPPDLKREIVPPPAAITQTREDGSLFIAATDDTFDVGNPAHVAAAKALYEAIEPINKWSLLKQET